MPLSHRSALCFARTRRALPPGRIYERQFSSTCAHDARPPSGANLRYPFLTRCTCAHRRRAIPFVRITLLRARSPPLAPRDARETRHAFHRARAPTSLLHSGMRFTKRRRGRQTQTQTHTHTHPRVISAFQKCARCALCAYNVLTPHAHTHRTHVSVFGYNVRWFMIWCAACARIAPVLVANAPERISRAHTHETRVCVYVCPTSACADFLPHGVGGMMRYRAAHVRVRYPKYPRK